MTASAQFAVPPSQVITAAIRFATREDETPGFREFLTSASLAGDLTAPTTDDRAVSTVSHSGGPTLSPIPAESPVPILRPNGGKNLALVPLEPKRKPFRFRRNPDADALIPSPTELRLMRLGEFWLEAERLQNLSQPLPPEVLEVIKSRPERVECEQRIQRVDAVLGSRDRSRPHIKRIRAVITTADQEILDAIETYCDFRLQGFDGDRLPRLETRAAKTPTFSVRVHTCAGSRICKLTCNRFTRTSNAGKLVRDGYAVWDSYERGGKTIEIRSAIRLTGDYQGARGRSNEFSVEFRPVVIDPIQGARYASTAFNAPVCNDKVFRATGFCSRCDGSFDKDVHPIFHAEISDSRKLRPYKFRRAHWKTRPHNGKYAPRSHVTVTGLSALCSHEQWNEAQAALLENFGMKEIPDHSHSHKPAMPLDALMKIIAAISSIVSKP